MDERDEPLDAIYDRVQADLAAERGPLGWLRARSTPARGALVIGVALASVGGVALAAGPASPWAGRSALDAVAVVGLLVALALAVRAALQPLHRPQWRGAARVALIGGLLALALGAVALGSDGSIGSLGGGGCFVAGLVAAAPVFAVALLVHRAPSRGAPLAAVAGGLAGTLAAHTVCPGQPLAHAVAAHFGVLASAALLLGGLGTLVARRVA